MYEEYLKDTDVRELTNDERNRELIYNVIKTKIELNQANKGFEDAEGDLIDYYIYQIKAHQAKLDYLIKKMKSEGLALDMIREIEIRGEKIG